MVVLGRKTSSRPGAHATSGYGTGSRATQVKQEQMGGESSGSQRASRASGVKREDGGYISSDDDEDANLPRKDIEMIEISSSEEDAGASSIRREKMNLPVRVGRREHHARFIGINTEASADLHIKGQQQFEVAGTSNEAGEGASRKGKAKVKDLETTDVQKPYKGVWQDADEPEVQIEPEPANDDEEQGSAEEVGIYAAANKAVDDQGTSSPDVEKKGKARTKLGREPVLQTDEDRQEWARFQTNLRHIRAELGPVPEDADVAGDVAMGDAGDTAGRVQMSVRDNNVYLFQLPPVMPDLLRPTVKSEPADESLAAQPTTQASIKVEEGAAFASGFVGKLRVHESGRTTLDWGGTSYELNPGQKASYMQDVVSLHLVPEKDRVVEEDGGEATSYGRVKGKFVVVPAWDRLLG